MEYTPFLAKTGFLVGLISGLAASTGIFSIGFALAGLWLGNAINALISKEIVAHIAQYWRPEEQHYVASEQPLKYWVQVISEFTIGLTAIFCLLKQL